MAAVRIEIVDLATMQGIPAHLDGKDLTRNLEFHVVTGSNGVFNANLGPGNYIITVSSSGYTSVDWPVHIENDGTIRQGLSKLSNTQAIKVSGREFLIAGQRYRPKMCSDFLLVKRKADGEDIIPVLQQRKSIGVDMVRIFTMARIIADFNPHTYDVRAVLSATLNDIHSVGMRAQVEGFADVQLIGLTIPEQQAHQDIVCDVIRTLGSMDLYDLCNEYDKNGIEPNNFTKPVGVISSKGSKQNNKPPAAPYWDYGTYHPRRDGNDYYFSKFLSDITPQCEIYVGVEGEPPATMPVIPDEPIGFAENNVDGRRSNYAGYAYRLGVIYSMYLNGVCFHSDEGIQSVPFTGNTLTCGQRFFKGCDDARQGW